MSGEHLELSRVDHSTGDLQLDSFSFESLQPGQKSLALREKTPINDCCHMKSLNIIIVAQSAFRLDQTVLLIPNEEDHFSLKSFTVNKK